MMKSGIVFLDWDGTLSHGRFWSELGDGIYQKVQQRLFGQNGSLVNEWMKGAKTSEDVCEWLESSVECGSRDLLDALIKSCEGMNLPEIIRRLIVEIRKDRHVVLITDNMDCFSRFTVKANRMEELFDYIVNSSDVRRLKQDQGGLSFHEVAQRYSTSFRDCVLIDDSQKTCALFQEMGGLSYQTSGIQHTIDLLGSLVEKPSTPL
jgi:FMN phosphatase YigB (HAD superfamily)